MTRKIFIPVLLLSLASCGVVKKKTTYGKERKITVEASEKDSLTTREEASIIPAPEVTDKADEIIRSALTYSGVRYKFGGTTRKGMDCSGLLYVSFGEHDIALPRVSHQMAQEGKRIRINQVTKGDLLFFKTSRRGRKINHVGLVVEVAGDDIRFIHSTSSRGVIVSSLREGFWNYAFVKATRVL
ncbi:C40 family peptidase [Poritiphilus flavus]|uniref:NlpC/P60 family protein n=1 Tax=Poritiphilus flavus TaxID=2697053 RepID=A0A6L9EDN7_9FLAO|nr:C40 family peptidase [Poritiphilus flavus]NAS12816.1 NlpC/P60 family protein [Poritiphilus flavus]